VDVEAAVGQDLEAPWPLLGCYI